VPPTVSYNDRDFGSNPQTYEPERVGYDSGGSGDDEYHHNTGDNAAEAQSAPQSDLIVDLFR